MVLAQCYVVSDVDATPILDAKLKAKDTVSSVLYVAGGNPSNLTQEFVDTHVMQGTSGSHNGKADGYYDTNGNSYSSGKCKFVVKNEGIVFT